jgi:hypothetical protein
MMSILAGGGALKLLTDTFTNGVPAGLGVDDIIYFTVTNPIPPPAFTGNIVQSINFFAVSASGFMLSENLPNSIRTTYMVDGFAIASYKPFKYWNGDEWIDVIAKRWNGTRWIGLPWKKYNESWN